MKTKCSLTGTLMPETTRKRAERVNAFSRLAVEKGETEVVSVTDLFMESAFSEG